MGLLRILQLLILRESLESFGILGILRNALGSFGSPSGFSGILRDLSESFGNPSEAFGSPPESFRNLRDPSGILRDLSEILQESSKCCCQLILHAKKIDTLQTFSPREEIKQQGVKLTGTENLSATLPRQLEGRTKKRQPRHLVLRT